MNETIRQLIQDFSLDLYEPIFPRDLALGDPLEPRAGNLATVIVGMRRSGKSYRLFQEIKALLAKGIDPERILYFSFEDDRLDPVTTQTGDEVLQTFRLLHPESFEQGLYLFFDEIQEMEDWDRWLRRVIDTTRCTVYVTGSSSKLLIEDVATAFRGRSISYELLPLSFSEFVRFHDESLASKPFSSFTTSQKAKVQNLCCEYLKRGGFPAVQQQPLPIAYQTLQSYSQRVVAKDVLERHNISQGRGLAIFAQKVLAMTAREISLRKMEDRLRSQGIKVIRAALSEWLTYFQDAYMVATVKDRKHALSETSTASPKVYAIDPGLAAANSPASTDDEGHRLETAVYLELRRRNPLLRMNGIASYRTAEGNSVDFCVGDVLEDCALRFYQVTVSLDDEATRKRELRSLDEAMSECHVSDSWLITLNGAAEDIATDSGTIHVIPAAQWLFGEEAEGMSE